MRIRFGDKILVDVMVCLLGGAVGFVIYYLQLSMFGHTSRGFTYLACVGASLFVTILNYFSLSMGAKK